MIREAMSTMLMATTASCPYTIGGCKLQLVFRLSNTSRKGTRGVMLERITSSLWLNEATEKGSYVCMASIHHRSSTSGSTCTKDSTLPCVTCQWASLCRISEWDGVWSQKHSCHVSDINIARWASLHKCVVGEPTLDLLHHGS